MSTQQILKTYYHGGNPFKGILYPGCILICFILSFFIGTEYIAINTGHPGLYQPFSELIWTFQAATHGIKDEVYLTGMRISAIILVISIFLVNTVSNVLRRRVKKTDIHGSAQWATEDDLIKANLLQQQEGIYIGGWEDEKKKTIEYLKDDTESHAIVIAPTGSGKGVGLVIPNLLSWTGSVIVIDIKGENYHLTSGYRKQELNQCVMAFNPTCVDMILDKEEFEAIGVDWSNFSQKAIQAGWAESVGASRINFKEDLGDIKNKLQEIFPEDAKNILTVLQRPHDGSCACFNPLNEVRMGIHEVKDVQAIAEMVIDPFGKGELDHWHRAAKSLIVGVILHVIYARKDKTLTGVVDFLSDPKRHVYEVFESMLLTEHDPQGVYGWIDKSTGQPTKVHPIIAAVAREMKDKQFEELNGIISTSLAFLTLYRDPIMARNTSKSDFSISDILKGDKPLSLYVTVPPSDLQRVVPLTRLLVNLICSRLMGNTSLVINNSLRKNRKLLLMLDEFPALGRMESLKTALSYMRGYGLRAFLICQELDQLYDIYGDKNPILGHCNIRIAYAANTDITARRISALAGETTILKESKNYSGEQVSSGFSEIKRSLILPDEVLRLPDTDMLIFYHKNPIYGKKIFYYKDPWFTQMSEIKPVPVSDKLSSKNGFASLCRVVEYKRPKFEDHLSNRPSQSKKEENNNMNKNDENAGNSHGQSGIILKSKFSELGYAGITILMDLINKGILEDLSPTYVCIKPNVELKEDIVREIAKNDFEEVWSLLKQNKDGFDKNKSP